MAAGIGLGFAMSHCGGDGATSLSPPAVTEAMAPPDETEPAQRSDNAPAFRDESAPGPPFAPVAPPTTSWPVAVAPAATRDAGVAPTPAPPPAPAPATAEAPNEEPPPPSPAPAPAETMMSVPRNTDPFALTRSSFDDEDIVDEHPVPDHAITRSSFDDEDRRDDHPTGP